MTTATQIVDDALRVLGLRNQFQEDPYLQQQCFRVLVDLLETYRADNIYVCPQIPPSISGDLKEFQWARLGIKHDLAFHAAPFLQVGTFPVNFMQAHSKAMETLLDNGEPPIEPQFPNTLPIGSGNEWYHYSWSYRFYTENDNAIYNYTDHQIENKKVIYYADFDSDATRKGTTVASVVWFADRGSSITITDESLSGNVASALVEFNASGQASFLATATYANGETQDFGYLVNVSPIVRSVI